MSATPGRVICARCGANNFETQAACWKCAASLAPGAVPVLSPAANIPGAAPAAAYRPAASVDSSIAIWCGIILAVLFPYVAVPAGLVFMMLDDRRKLEVGRVTLIAGIVASIFHFMITAALIQNMFTTGLGTMVKQVRQMQNPGLNDSVSDRELDGIPGMPGLGNQPRTAPPQTFNPNPPDVPFPAPLK